MQIYSLPFQTIKNKRFHSNPKKNYFYDLAAFLIMHAYNNRFQILEIDWFRIKTFPYKIFIIS